MKNNNMKQGFTLVELSIVLVIIGLLIGGILVAQSLIDSTKMQAFIRQTGQYDSAIALFEDKFGDLPGDNALFGTATNGGTLGDGQIHDDDGASLLFNSEIGAVWADLAAAGLKNESGTDYAALRTTATTNAAVAGTNFPEIGIGSSAGLILVGTGSGSNHYVAGLIDADAADAVIDISATASIAPADALAIDAKLDDGVANTGDVVANDNVAPGTAVADDTCQASGVYTVTTTTGTCVPYIRLGLSTGVLK